MFLTLSQLLGTRAGLGNKGVTKSYVNIIHQKGNHRKTEIERGEATTILLPRSDRDHHLSGTGFGPHCPKKDP